MSPQLNCTRRGGKGRECWGPQIRGLRGRATRQGHKTSAFWASHEIYVHPCWHVTALEEAGDGERCFEAAWECIVALEGMVGSWSPVDFSLLHSPL